MSAVQSRYQAIPIAVDGTVTCGNYVGGFLAKTAGAISITSNGRLLVDAVPVAAGQWLSMPFVTGSNAATVTLSGGASGTLAAG